MTNGNPVLAARKNSQPRRMLCVMRSVTWSRVVTTQAKSATPLLFPLLNHQHQCPPSSLQHRRALQHRSFLHHQLQPGHPLVSFILSGDPLRNVSPHTWWKGIKQSEACGMRELCSSMKARETHQLCSRRRWTSSKGGFIFPRPLESRQFVPLQTKQLVHHPFSHQQLFLLLPLLTPMLLLHPPILVSLLSSPLQPLKLTLLTPRLVHQPTMLLLHPLTLVSLLSSPLQPLKLTSGAANFGVKYAWRGSPIMLISAVTRKSNISPGIKS